MNALVKLFDDASNAAYQRNLEPANLGVITASGVKLRHPLRSGWLYVRRGVDGELGNTLAYNQGAPVMAHLPVLLRWNRGRYEIVGVDSSRAPSYGGGSSVPKHNHRTGSGLEYEQQSKLIDRGRVKWSSGLTVSVGEFRYRKSDGTWETYPGGTLDLTSYVPGTADTHAWVVVGVDPSDNTAKAAAGTPVATGTALDTADIDGILDNAYIPLAAIDVANGDTALSTPGDYVDARGWLNQATGSQGTWTPAITGSVSNPTVTYTVQEGNYVRLGPLVFFSFRLVINTISGGSGSLRVSLPVEVGSVSSQAAAYTGAADLPAGTNNVVFNAVNNQSFGAYACIVDNVGESVLQISAVAAGDDLRATGFYITA